MFIPTAILLASTTMLVGGAFLGTPYNVTLVQDKFGPGGAGWVASPNGPIANENYAKYMPDGKSWAFRRDKGSLDSPMIIGMTYDFRMQSPTQYIRDVNQTAGKLTTEVPNNLQYSAQHGNYVTLNPTLPIPPANDTGFRGQGNWYDSGPMWLMNAFRLSETSDPSANNSQLIGFSHNEDYLYNGSVRCTWKSVGVRYSNDSGLTWTRSVPILNKGIQPEQAWPNCGSAGTGDMAAMWNFQQKQWQIFTQEVDDNNHGANALVMAVSTDPLAKPYSWTRVNPVPGGTTRPGFDKLDDHTNYHSDLQSIRGSNPSIIYDSLNGYWHMVYAIWGGGLAYSKSTDGLRWATPVALGGLNFPHVEYPTLIGNYGDTYTTDGKATLYFKTWESSTVSGWAVMRAVDVQFPLS